MSSFGSLLSTLCGVEPGRPRLTWYGPLGERVEISGAVLRQWVAKASNVFTEELDVDEDTTFACHDSHHWLSVVAAMGMWSLGAMQAKDHPDVIIATTPPQQASAHVVAIATSPMAVRMPTHVAPWWSMDFVDAARGGADQPLYDAPHTPRAPSPSTTYRGERIAVSGESIPAVWQLASLLVAGNSLVIVTHADGADTEGLLASENVSAHVA